MRSRVQTPLKSWLFQASLRNCLNCVHNCDDSSLDCLVFFHVPLVTNNPFRLCQASTLWFIFILIHYILFVLCFFSRAACNCNSQGSLNESCNEFGVCNCKSGVLGIKCDSCAENKHNLTAGCIGESWKWRMLGIKLAHSFHFVKIVCLFKLMFCFHLWSGIDALTFKQCVLGLIPDSMPYLGCICLLSTVLCSSPQGFSSGLLFFPLNRNQNFHLTWIIVSFEVTLMSRAPVDLA